MKNRELDTMIEIVHDDAERRRQVDVIADGLRRGVKRRSWVQQSLFTVCVVVVTVVLVPKFLDVVCGPVEVEGYAVAGGADLEKSIEFNKKVLGLA